MSKPYGLLIIMILTAVIIPMCIAFTFVITVIIILTKSFPSPSSP